MKIIIRILALIALAISIGWLINEPNFEPAITAVVSLSTFISTFLFWKKEKESTVQKQTVKENSIAIQAGGNVSIDLIKNSEKEKQF